MTFRKRIRVILAACLAAAMLAFVPHPAAAEDKKARFIAVVYDDSGSMRYVKNKNKLKNYIYANYSLQNLVALMDDSDSAKVYLISKKGRNPITVKKQKNLYGEFQDVTAVKNGNTYADTIHEACKAGAEFLKANPGGEFLFVLITDGDTMYTKDDKEINDQLQNVFRGYIKGSGLDKLGARTRALLLSIGTGKLLTPVSDMAAVLGESGIPVQTFKADVSVESKAGDAIMAAMTDLGESMASTNSMAIEPGKPFTVRYPLDSLVIMEQFQHTSASMITGITDSAGKSLNRQTLFSTKAIDNMKLASTFSQVKSATGYVMPGTYMLKASGEVNLLAFSKVSFDVNITVTDAQGLLIAQYAGGKWSVERLAVALYERLTAKATLALRNGAEVEIGPYVAIGAGEMDAMAFSPGGGGSFTLEAVQAGQGYLNLTLSDPEFFQLSIPPLALSVEAAQATASQAPQTAAVTTAAPSSASPGPASATPTLPATPQPTPASEPRRMKLELSADRLAFGVMDTGGSLPSCTWKAFIEEGGKWREMKPAELLAVEAVAPGGLTVSVDKANGKIVVSPAGIAAFTSTGDSAVILRIGTGKPGETAEASIAVSVHDDWRKWLALALEVAALLLAAGYIILVSLKKRIPMQMEVYVSENADMALAVTTALKRNMARRNVFPFGRETVTLGLMELYPHPKSRKHVVLSSICVQYGLRIDGKPPQFHKARDGQGDYIIGENNIVGIRENGQYRYYRFLYNNTGHNPKA